MTPELSKYFSDLGKKGAKKRLNKMTKEERSEHARMMALAMHKKAGHTSGGKPKVEKREKNIRVSKPDRYLGCTGRERTRMAVRVRDNFTCQTCGDIRRPEDVKKGSGMRLFDVHHLNGLCGKLSRAYDPIDSMDGMITLCHKCHYNHPEHTIKMAQQSARIQIEKLSPIAA